MSVGARHLTVLRQFRPFAFTVEEADGDLPESGAVSASFVQEKYQYYLFGSEITRETSSDAKRSTGIDISGDESAPCSSDLGEHELFVRDNRIIWSMGTRVYKRYTAQSAIIMVCWCRMDSISEPLLCALQTDYLTLYTSQGDEFCVPLPYYVTSIFPLKSGLLLQKAADVSRAILQSSPPLHRKEISRSRDHGFNPFKPLIRDDPALISSHLVLKHPLEEPQATYFEERGKLSLMKDFEEKTIWTSDQIPLMASYNKSKFQHSIWNIDNVGPTLSIPSELSSHQLAFQRIWQGKCSQSPASKVFLGTDIDATPVLCLLFSDQKLLLGIRLQIDEDNHEGFFDIKPLNSWSIPAIDVAPIIVTRPRVKSGILPFTDILVLTPENDLFLYSGNQCLCRYILPDNLGGHGLGEPKIIGVKDSVQGRINVFCNNNEVYRCILRKYPCSSLVKDCLTAMSEGLNSSFYAHFLSLLWSDNNSSYLSHSDSHPDQEWESFINEMIKLCNKLGLIVSKRKDSVLSNGSAWGFLLDSGFHARYQKKFSGSFLSISPNNEDSVMSNYSCNYENKENNEEVNYYTGLVKETLDSLHALYESLKLNILRNQDVENLAGLLINISAALNETNYIDYYARDFPCLSPTISLPKNYENTPPTNPPCLFRFLESCLQKGGKTVKNSTDIPNLITTSKSSVLGWARKVVLFYKLLLGVESEEIKMKIKLSSSRSNKDEITILSMVHEKFGRQHLDLLPVGVSLPLRHVLDKCREEPPYDLPASAYMLIGREDLAMQHGSQSSSAADLVSSSVPYMLHLQPVTVPSSASDPTVMELSSSDDPEGRNVEDGMEHIFNSTTQLRFGRDLRLNEARRLLCSAKPVAVPMSVNPSANDQEVQQHKLWNLAQRTTALPFGRGAFTLATTYTLLTEALVIPKLVLTGRLPAQQNATVNLDPNVRNVSELSSWPDFHNGVAAGLRLAPFQGKMARTWILYNRPDEANYTHAGLLLALGLHGHLQVLSTTDVYRYLSQEHDITSASLLLGLAASNRGTMNAEISKTLNVHIPRHPASLEFELPTLLQSSALMAIGLLYEGSAHPLTMKMLLGEIGRKSGSDNVLEWEGYAVAAGSALGVVALGRGGDAFGFAESFVDRLFDYIGTKGFYSLSDGKQVNFYVTAPGATIALALIFLKTEVEEIANRLQIPATQYDLQYVRPDFIMLRIIARNLIMWTRIQPSREWIESQVPEFIRIAIVKTGEDSINGDDYESEALFQAYVNIVTGACISLGLKYAGTKNGDVQELLYNYAIYFLNEMKNIGAASSLKLPKGLLQQVDRATLELCVHLVVLSLTLVMAGSGHLQTLRLLRYLRSRSSAEGHINYGLQMAVSLGIGFLFLGSGMQTFSTQNSAIAALLITLYPRLPTGPNDNRCHLQAFRHFYVLAAESRWIQTVDVDTGLPVYCPIEISVKETHYYSETTFCEVTPCLLPERSVLKSIRVCGPRYWSQFIELEPEDKGWWRVGDKKNPFNGGLIYIKRKVGSCSYSDDPVGCQSLLSRAMHKVSGAWGMGASGPGENLNSLKVDQLVSTFSSDPSLIAFAKLCCDSSPHQSFDSNFQEFCSQVLYECVSKDRPALLQVYLCLYTMIEAISAQVRNGSPLIQDTIFISSLKVGLAYSEALVKDRLNKTNGGGIIQHKFIESLRKRIEDSLSISQGIKENLVSYLNEQEWPSELNKADKVLLCWYLLWYDIPSPRTVSSALDKVRNNEVFSKGFSMVPLLKMLLPGTHLEGLVEIEKFRVNLGR